MPGGVSNVFLPRQRVDGALRLGPCAGGDDGLSQTRWRDERVGAWRCAHTGLLVLAPASPQNGTMRVKRFGALLGGCRLGTEGAYAARRCCFLLAVGGLAASPALATLTESVRRWRVRDAAVQRLSARRRRERVPQGDCLARCMRCRAAGAWALPPRRYVTDCGTQDRASRILARTVSTRQTAFDAVLRALGLWSLGCVPGAAALRCVGAGVVRAPTRGRRVFAGSAGRPFGWRRSPGCGTWRITKRLLFARRVCSCVPATGRLVAVVAVVLWAAVTLLRGC